MLRKVTPDKDAPTMPKATTIHGAFLPATKKVDSESPELEEEDQRLTVNSRAMYAREISSAEVGVMGPNVRLGFVPNGAHVNRNFVPCVFPLV